MSKAGSSLLRTTFFRAADTARKQDPQLAKIYYTQMVERGANHVKALCVVAAHLAERAWAVMARGMPYVICDINGEAVTTQQAKTIIAEHWTVPPQVRARRRSTKTAKAGKAPNKSTLDKPRQTGGRNRGDLPHQNDLLTRPLNRSRNQLTPVGRQEPQTQPQANAEAQMAFARSRLPVPSAWEMSRWSTRSAASMNDVDIDQRRHTMAIE